MTTVDIAIAKFNDRCDRAIELLDRAIESLKPKDSSRWIHKQNR
jgi:hypothetical protein